MDKAQPSSRTHLFTFRVWLEDLGEGQVEWRGEVQHVVSGERRFFRDWPALISYLQAKLPMKGERSMSTEENKAAERRFYEEVWHKRNLAAIDELVAPNIVEHNPNVPGQGTGREGFRQSIEMILSVSPDVQITIEDLIAEGEKVVVRWLARGTHQGEFMGIPPTNRQTTVMGIDIIRYEGGQRVETWRQFDMLGWLQQLGVIPTLGERR